MMWMILSTIGSFVVACCRQRPRLAVDDGVAVASVDTESVALLLAIVGVIAGGTLCVGVGVDAGDALNSQLVSYQPARRPNPATTSKCIPALGSMICVKSGAPNRVWASVLSRD